MGRRRGFSADPNSNWAEHPLAPRPGRVNSKSTEQPLWPKPGPGSLRIWFLRGSRSNLSDASRQSRGQCGPSNPPRRETASKAVWRSAEIPVVRRGDSHWPPVVQSCLWASDQSTNQQHRRDHGDPTRREGYPRGDRFSSVSFAMHRGSDHVWQPAQRTAPDAVAQRVATARSGGLKVPQHVERE